ncbi:MAG: exo-alpha-sialidase [Bryobacterales bacterium]|nr:exo-alpha-sialidase [Bryobacterales bacterium]
MRLFAFFLLLPVACMAIEPLAFEVKVDTIAGQTAPEWQWFHPRPAAIPGFGKADASLSIITLQKHLFTSDYYSGLFTMTSQDFGKTWTGPIEIPELGWRKEPDAVDIAVADVTPGWHGKTGKLIAIGAQVRYDKQGRQLDDKPQSHQTAYAVFDPRMGKWSPWKMIRMPAERRFNFARSACAQWLEMDDGTVLLPFYHGPNASAPHSVTVAQFRFNGRELEYLRHGSEHELNVVRGLVEPSIVKYAGRYFLTIRNDLKGYVTVSEDGLRYGPIKEWTFDDGGELGSYNTQQHWLAHSDGLFLAYTRKGANNDHIIRHRAPLFLAQVDPEKLQVMRRTEKILLPERGATYGNFGAAAMTAEESWVTDAEGMFSKAARERGARGRVLVARVIWSKPNRLVKRRQGFRTGR